MIQIRPRGPVGSLVVLGAILASIGSALPLVQAQDSPRSSAPRGLIPPRYSAVPRRFATPLAPRPTVAPGEIDPKFVIHAPGEIDPKIIVTQSAEIDPKIVIQRERSDWAPVDRPEPRLQPLGNAHR